jgi:ribosomal protein S20
MTIASVDDAPMSRLARADVSVVPVQHSAVRKPAMRAITGRDGMGVRGGRPAIPAILGRRSGCAASAAGRQLSRRTRGSFTLAKTPRTWQGARTPSGLKRVRSAERRHAILQPRRTAAKSLVKKALSVATTPADGEDPQAALALAISALDRAAKAGAIHRNAASRRKSRLASKVAAFIAGAAVQGGARTTKTTGTTAAQKAAKARIAAGKAAKAKGAQTAAGKARAALTRTARTEAAETPAPTPETPAATRTTRSTGTRAAGTRTTSGGSAKASASATKASATKAPSTKSATKASAAKAPSAKAAAPKTSRPKKTAG